MKNYNHLNQLYKVLLLILLAILSAGNVYAAPGDNVAGEVTMLVGQAVATTATGGKRPLKKGAMVYVGDTIETGKKCYIKIKYTDGSTILLRPDTGLVIDSYSDTDNGGGQSVATLLKGGLRSVTGAISAEKKQNYKIKTPVATLGIRGTDFVMRLCQETDNEKDGKKKNDCDDASDDGLYTSTNDGGTDLKNGAGTLNSEAGEHAYVESFDIPPIRLVEAPRVITIDNLPNPLDDSADFIPGNACGAP